MILKSLELLDFRNYEKLQMELDPGTNIIYGDNAQGKTNILESIYLSGTTKSHKGSKDREMIRFGCEEAHIRTVVEKGRLDHQVDLHLKKSRSKGIAIDQLPIKKASQLFGILNLVFFSPEDLNIIKNGPSERRRFLDVELCQLDRVYLHYLTKYNKILNQRNRLLKDISHHAGLLDTLDIWDLQLVKCGRHIIEVRQSFIEKLNVIIIDIHRKLSGGKETLILKYEPDAAADDLEEKLKKCRERDLKLGQTGAGPHRDDLLFSIHETDIRRFGSQGQQRTSALSLKLAELTLVKESISETPILLLDDVLSELDSSRQNFLLNSIHDIQTLITCTGLDEFVKNRFQINKVFQVVEGHVRRKNHQ